MLSCVIEADGRFFEGQIALALQETFETFRFDLHRRGIHVGEADLKRYAELMGISFVRAIGALLGLRIDVSTEGTKALARAGCRTFMLRDYQEDLQVGYYALPREYQNGIEDPNEAAKARRGWFRSSVQEIQSDFQLAIHEINSAPYLSRLVANAFLYPRLAAFHDIAIRDDVPTTVLKIGPLHRLVWVGVAVVASMPVTGALISAWALRRNAIAVERR